MTDFEVLEDMIEDWTEYVSELADRVSVYTEYVSELQDKLDRAKRELAELRRLAGKQKENEDV